MLRYGFDIVGGLGPLVQLILDLSRGLPSQIPTGVATFDAAESQEPSNILRLGR